MIHDFEDFCLYAYVIVDDIWQQIAPQFTRPGPEPLWDDTHIAGHPSFVLSPLATPCRPMHSIVSPFRVPVAPDIGLTIQYRLFPAPAPCTNCATVSEIPDFDSAVETMTYPLSSRPHPAFRLTHLAAFQIRSCISLDEIRLFC